VDQHVCYDQVAYGLGRTGRAEELVQRLGFAACRGQRAGTLSGGTRQKLSLTLALMHDPPVLLLDEPYQGFDWQTCLASWGLTDELRDRGTAPLVISHLVFEHGRFDRICHLRDGQVHEGAGRHAAAVDTAIRLSLAGQVRNRFAWILLVVFVPVWYLVIGSMTSHSGVVFRLRSTGASEVVDGHDLTLITAGLSSITLITGFVVFAAVRRSRPFDRRLVLSGYRPLP
jgi:energy-coupling factor transporter ATP-binding protein EcfA2